MTLELLLLRHAKSSRDDLSLDDHSRPLNKRGKDAARAMARYLRKNDLKPDLILCSTAERTRRTLDPILETWPNVDVNYADDLYLASIADALSLLRRACSADRILMLGHNPTMENTAHYLMDKSATQTSQASADMSVKYPTGALAVLELDIESWKDIEKRCGRLTRFIKPRDLAERDHSSAPN